MKLKAISAGVLSALVLAGVSLAGSVPSEGVSQSVFDMELQKVRYHTALGGQDGQPFYAALEDDEDVTLSELAQAEAPPPEYKSPGRAFVYSLLVPGLGQYYYGSRMKPVLFLAAEIVGWSYAMKYHGEGDDITAEFEAFNREHWYRDSYEDYLDWVYGTLRPDTIPDTNYEEFTHVLPNERNQEYYEMTGKYNQFGWGWDDAALPNGQVLSDFSEGSPPQPIKTSLDWIPVSDNREAYEVMRGDANNKYDKAMRWVYIVMANHLISAFEAYFKTKSQNNRLRYEQEFARVSVDAQLRSYTSWKDTPYVNVTYRF